MSLEMDLDANPFPLLLLFFDSLHSAFLTNLPSVPLSFNLNSSFNSDHDDLSSSSPPISPFPNFRFPRAAAASCLNLVLPLHSRSRSFNRDLNKPYTCSPSSTSAGQSIEHASREADRSKAVGPSRPLLHHPLAFFPKLFPLNLLPPLLLEETRRNPLSST